MRKTAVSPFLFDSYRDFLEAWISAREGGGRGLKSRIAEEIDAGSGFITQVFSGAAQFSLEQGMKIARWMALSPKEVDFFILLIESDRAGTAELRQYFTEKKEHSRKQYQKLAHRLSAKAVPEQIDQAVYFSSWVYAAVHVALTCERLGSESAIAKSLNLPPAQVRRVLEFLKSSGLAKIEAGSYRAGDVRMHLGTASPWLLRHHLNWSLRALAATEADITKGLHYSSVISLSKADHKVVNEILADAIARIKQTVAASPGEAVYGFTANFFEV